MPGGAPLPPHAPEIGGGGRLLGRFHVTGVFWFRFHEWAARTLPDGLKSVIITIFTLLFFFTLRRIRRAIAANLVPVLGECGFWERQRRVYRTFREFAWCQTERYERLSSDSRITVEIDDPGYWAKLNESGVGFILLTGHVGNWEIGAARASLGNGRCVHVVREPEIDPRAQAFVERLLSNEMGAPVTTHFATGDFRLGVVLREALRRGDIVALQGDRPRTGGRTIDAQLFGRLFRLPEGPFVLAWTARARLVPVFVFRESRLKYRTAVRGAILVNRTADRRSSLREAAREMAAAIEWAIREKPHQWFCFRDLWRDL